MHDKPMRIVGPDGKWHPLAAAPEVRTLLLGDAHTTHTTKAQVRKERAAARAVTRAKLLPADPPHRQAGLVPLDQLNDNEQRVLFALESNGPSSIADLARVAWADEGPLFIWGHVADEQRAQSWVRNALRRLVASGWVVALSSLYVAPDGTTRERRLYGPHESLEPRLGGLAVADAEDAHDRAQRRFEAQAAEVEALKATLAKARDALAINATHVRATWKALLAARKAVR